MLGRRSRAPGTLADPACQGATTQGGRSWTMSGHVVWFELEARPAHGCWVPLGAGIIRPRSGRVPERPKGAVCKIAGIAYTGSNPVPATTALSCGNAAAGWAITPA